MNKELPSADEVAAQLRAIEELVRVTAKREETLNQGKRLNHSRRRADADEALVESNRRLEMDSASAETDRISASERFGQRQRNRRTWLDRAHRSVRTGIDEKIRALEGQAHYDRQKTLIQIDRQRDEESAQARTSFDDLRVSLGDSQRRQSDVEKRARRAVRGYGGFSRRLHHALSLTADPAGGSDVTGLLQSVKWDLDRAEDALEELEALWLAALFRFLPLSIGLILILGGHAAAHLLLPPEWGGQQGLLAVLSAAGCSVVAIGLHLIGGWQARPMVVTIRSGLADARASLSAAAREVEREEEMEFARIEARHRRGMAGLQQSFKRMMDDAEQLRNTAPAELEQRHRKSLERHERLGISKAARLLRSHQENLARLREEARAREQVIAAELENRMEHLQARFEQDWEALLQNWHANLPMMLADLDQAGALSSRLTAAWSADALGEWQPPDSGAPAVPIGVLQGQVATLAGVWPQSPLFSVPAQEFEAPVCLRMPDQASLVIETDSGGRAAALAALNLAMYRLLASQPPGRVNFTLFDPVGLGESFSSLMRLADSGENLINGKIWTQPEQMERRLAELNEHMEKIIQMYLRNEFATIADYNAQAGNVAENNRFLAVADFPQGFSTTALQRLLSIALAGPRCGVYLLLHWNTGQPVPAGLKAEDLRRHALSLAFSGGALVLQGQPEGVTLRLDSPPSPEVAGMFLDRVGRASVDSNRVEIPFSSIAPPEEAVWSQDTINELRVPIGRTGASKFQWLALGKATRQHALIAGKTGSGKSTLFHVIITNLALWADPRQVEFYLVDFKKGVEFQCYARLRLPHARVVAVESDREFGLSVLQRLDEELRRRGELFREKGAQDLAGYSRAGGREPMPRCLLLIDEFQEFFTEDDRVAQNAALLLDRIVRQGRAFGMHVILGSQTLGGAFTLARPTLGQMAVRIALQCNEADSYLILDDGNPAARLLSRPGEGIYNDQAGAIEGNSPFQVVWLPDEVREAQLVAVRERADQAGFAGFIPFVFEGNVAADVWGNEPLRRLLAQPGSLPGGMHLFLGAPNAVAGPVSVCFQPQSGSHLLLAGQQEETVLALVAIALVTLACQAPEAGLRSVVLASSAPETAERRVLDQAIGQARGTASRIGAAEIAATFAELAAEVRRRGTSQEGIACPPIFVFILGLQRFKALRHEEDYSFSSAPVAIPKPSEDLVTLIEEGAAVGVHLVLHGDTWNNLKRSLPRKALGEIDMRVLFQMSANDSAALIDSPKAASLGRHRALLHREQEGTSEVFRPYALPDAAWFAGGGNRLGAVIDAEAGTGEGG
ncbi:MAG: DNA segregation ATPase FtsK/SpoIIIE [Verrucomicrobia bacterium]|nr:MAG: DNA segregation ATPase FtsK/SpoIIIE [Verrucomicrobiota bacterium]